MRAEYSEGERFERLTFTGENVLRLRLFGLRFCRLHV